MVSAKMVALAGAVTLFGATARAADMPQMLPPMPLPPIEDFAGGWYLRGDIGMTNQKVDKLDNVLFAGTPNLAILDKNFESGMLFGLGVGYEWNKWLRFDVTGEYRGETGFHGLDTWFDGVNARFNKYTGKKSEWLFLANVYADLGTWYAFTPFVGAGIGAAKITMHSFRDAGISATGTPTLAYADAESKWNFAWALHAGVSYKVTPAVSIEFAYRYTHLGDGQTGDIIAFDGTNNVFNPMHFKDITSHDLKLGIRWLLDAPAPKPSYEPLTLPPLMRRG